MPPYGLMGRLFKHHFDLAASFRLKTSSQHTNLEQVIKLGFTRLSMLTLELDSESWRSGLWRKDL